MEVGKKTMSIVIVRKMYMFIICGSTRIEGEVKGAVMSKELRKGRGMW